MVKPILVSKLSAYNEGSRPLSELIDLGRVILGIWVRYQKNTGQVFADINTYTNTSSLNVVIIEQFWKYTILSCLDRQRCQIGQFSAQIIGRFLSKNCNKSINHHTIINTTPWYKYYRYSDPYAHPYCRTKMFTHVCSEFMQWVTDSNQLLFSMQV